MAPVDHLWARIAVDAALSQDVAQRSDGVLLRSLIIAAILMAPVALWQRSRIMRRRQERLAAEQPEELAPATGTESGPTLEALFAEIAAMGGSLGSGDEAQLLVPDEITLDGRDPEPSLLAALLGDAITRGGLREVGRSRIAHATVITCQRR